MNEQKASPTSQYTSSPTNYNSQNGNSGNLSELDTLLQDLSSARYGSNLENKYGKSSLGSQNALNDSNTNRPTVDSLLEELTNAQNSGPIYAVPNGWVSLWCWVVKLWGARNIYFVLIFFFRVSASKSPGGKQITITVRETKTERMTPVNQSYPGKRPFILFRTNDL